jgi:hypothetical protein
MRRLVLFPRFIPQLLNPMKTTAPSIPKIRTASELKWHVEQSGECPHFFSRSSMRFFGDTMANYGVRAGLATVTTSMGEKVECFELYRRRPVKHGLASPAFFNARTFARVHPSS